MPGETVTDLRKKFEPKEEAPKPRIEKSELKGLAEKRKYAEEKWGVRAKQSQTPTPPKPEVTGGERGVVPPPDRGPDDAGSAEDI